jgi:hypothetical protein
MSSDVATIVYSYFFVIAAVGAAIAFVAKHAIKTHTDEIREDLRKVMYALYNDGKTGLINKVDDLLENQQRIRVDVEVLKAKIDHD